MPKCQAQARRFITHLHGDKPVAPARDTGIGKTFHHRMTQQHIFPSTTHDGDSPRHQGRPWIGYPQPAFHGLHRQRMRKHCFRKRKPRQ